MSSNKMVENEKILIPMAGLEIACDNVILQTFVGSCVAICIYDNSKKIGGMAHVMLPKNNSGKSTIGTKYEGKFADDAIDIMIEKMTHIFSDLTLQAKIVGGAKIFDNNNNSTTLNIGDRNISAIKSILQEKKITLVSQHLSLYNGCWVTFDCNSQKVSIKENNGEKII